MNLVILFCLNLGKIINQSVAGVDKGIDKIINVC